MYDFTVLIQIETQMQEQFRELEQAEAITTPRERRFAGWRLRLSAMLHTLAHAIEPSPPMLDCSPREQH